MEPLGQRTDGASPSTIAARVACGLHALVSIGAAAVVVTLRRANAGAEPEGQNWWLVTLLVVSIVYGVAGPALASRPERRLLGVAFSAIGLTAAISAVATQYTGFRDINGGGLRWLDAAQDWALPATAGFLVGVVPWLLAPSGRWRRAGPALAVAAVVVVEAVNAASSGPGWLDRLTTWSVAVAATAGTVRHAGRWWRARRRTPDPLPGWILAGSVAAWLAFVPASVGIADWSLAGADVIAALLLAATVPLLAGGAIVDAIRDTGSPFLGVSHRVLEWVILASGIVGIYTVVVAGLGRLVGGSGPTWFLVGATGAIAVALEPARRFVRRLVDRLVYGARDDPLAVVQRVVDHLGADAGDALLPTLVESLRTELRLDAVAIDLRVDGGWQQGASTGCLPARHRTLPLAHRGDVVGRLVVGWADGPALRARDEAILAQLVGPLCLAVGWVRLAEDLRRSSLAIVSAREEERRRLRRDLHDGLGPSLTGVSLGLRTALRQLERRADRGDGPTRILLQHVADEVDTAVDDLKRIVRDLRPTALDQLGLIEAVAEFSRSFGDSLDISLAVPSEPVQLPAAVENAAYRIVTEAVTNVVRHSRAARCWLHIETGPQVVIDVVDDGIGIAAAPAGGVGLTAMRERAHELGGTVDVRPNVPHGTCVHVRLPAALP